MRRCFLQYKEGELAFYQFSGKINIVVAEAHKLGAFKIVAYFVSRNL
jgi:hypothetical protein